MAIQYLHQAQAAITDLLSNPSVLRPSLPITYGNGPSCPANAPLSCANKTTVSDLCCFNYPGGQLLQTQFWDTHPATGPADAWTIHGLWPDHCDGSYDAYCDDNRHYTNISSILSSYEATDLLSDMSTYWKDFQNHDSNLWSHEWNKHATCISTLSVDCYSGSSYTAQLEVLDYFNRTVSLYKTLPSYAWLEEAGISPSSSTSYSRDKISSVLAANHGAPITLRCRNGELDEIWYHFSVKGSMQTGVFVPMLPDGTKGNCPSEVKYLPKTIAEPTGTRTSTQHVPQPTGPREEFVGRGYLKVRNEGSEKGCIISSGQWYVSGSCATFTGKKSDGGIVLRSRKGDCAVVGGRIKCASSIRSASTFGSNGDELTFEGNGTFWAEKVPRGFAKGDVFTDEAGHGTDLEIVWQGL